MGWWGYHSNQNDLTLDCCPEKETDRAFAKSIWSLIRSYEEEKVISLRVDFSGPAALGLTITALQNRNRLGIHLLKKVRSIASDQISLLEKIKLDATDAKEEFDLRIDAIKKEIIFIDKAIKNGGKTRARLNTPGLFETMLSNTPGKGESDV